MEAAACGCKIITTALDGTRELLEQAPEQMADLIDLPPLKTIDQPYAEDQPMLEKKLTRILEKNIRFFLDNRVVADESTRRYIQAYTWPKIFEKIQRIYSEMQ